MASRPVKTNIRSGQKTKNRSISILLFTSCQKIKTNFRSISFLLFPSGQKTKANLDPYHFFCSHPAEKQKANVDPYRFGWVSSGQKTKTNLDPFRFGCSHPAKKPKKIQIQVSVVYPICDLRTILKTGSISLFVPIRLKKQLDPYLFTVPTPGWGCEKILDMMMVMLLFRLSQMFRVVSFFPCEKMLNVAVLHTRRSLPRENGWGNHLTATTVGEPHQRTPCDNG